MTTDLKQIVLDNLLSIYKGEVNINAFFSIFAGKAQETIDVAETILGQFDIDLANGPLLDVFGSWIGLARPPKQEVYDNIFTLRSKYDDDLDPDNSTGFYNSTDGTGGYFCSYKGLPSQTEPVTLMSDSDYRDVIKTKVWTYRKKATLDNLFLHYFKLGARIYIDDETARQVVIQQVSYDDLNNWQRNFIRVRGMKPGGLKRVYVDNIETEMI